MRNPARRAGFSLFEVVLVVALLVVLAALSYPTLKSSYGYFKLHGGIDAVRAAWAQARAHAIDEGRPYRFAVEPGGSHFRIAPDAPEYWTGSAPSGDNKAYILQQSLPGGVRFAVNATPPEAPDDEKDSPDDAAGMNWSPTVVFLADGTAREDVQLVFNVRGVQPTAVKLRGLTCSVSVGPVKK